MEWNGIEFADVMSKLLRIPAISVFVSYDEIYIITMNRVFLWFVFCVCPIISSVIKCEHLYFH